MRTGDAPWYQTAFESAYLEVYAHRDQESARREVAGLIERGLAAAGGRVLDLACGAGRHSLALLEAGRDAFGLDLSRALLARARALENGALSSRLVRGDVRALPFADEAFTSVVMMFSSFGYFDDGDNARVLAQIARILKPKGMLVLDLMNAELIRRTLVAESRDQNEKRVLVQKRHLKEDGKRVVKEVEFSAAGAVTRHWREDVRLFEPGEIGELLETQGIVLQRVEGDFDGCAFGPDAPRMIVWARRGARSSPFERPQA